MICPICKKASARKYRPFCSGRCADLDLGHWLKGSYAIPEPDAEVESERSIEPSGRPPTRH